MSIRQACRLPIHQQIKLPRSSQRLTLKYIDEKADKVPKHAQHADDERMWLKLGDWNDSAVHQEDGGFDGGNECRD